MTPQQKQEYVTLLKTKGWIAVMYDSKLKHEIYAPTVKGEIYAVRLAKICQNEKSLDLLDMSYQGYQNTSETDRYLLGENMIVKYYDMQTHNEQVNITQYGYELLEVLLWLVNPEAQKKYRRALQFQKGLQTTFAQLDNIMKKTSDMSNKFAPKPSKKVVKKFKRSKNWWETN